MKPTKPSGTEKQTEELIIQIVPKKRAARLHKTIEPAEHKPLSEVKASFLEAGYPEDEVNDMIEAMLELPQYAGDDLHKGD